MSKRKVIVCKHNYRHDFNAVRLYNMFSKLYDCVVDYGIHDQSLFRFRKSEFRELLSQYCDFCCFDGNKFCTASGELKLLDFISYCYGIGFPSKCRLITSGNVLSYNTFEELNSLKYD